jgi:hypothetical protein
MNLQNINLKDSFERSQNILSGYSFDSLLLEIENLREINESSITAHFEKQIMLKIESARDVFKANLSNIIIDALDYRNLDEEPNKPTSEEWKAVMKSMSSNTDKPQEIKAEHGEYYYYHFLECLPPIMYGRTYTLCSEPYGGNSDGETTYIGIYQKNDKYFGVITSINKFKNLLK